MGKEDESFKVVGIDSIGVGIYMRKEYTDLDSSLNEPEKQSTPEQLQEAGLGSNRVSICQKN